MKREIKFRMWSSEVKKFFYDVENVYECLKLSKMSEHKGLYDDMTWQQYTGMVDKNGTEIYEGDIIRGLMDFGPAGFHERSAIVHWDIEKGYQWNYWKLFSIKIEGNMFENPELLELI
jgi:uncharacterized phage protein (TIGR01671 family)